MISKIFIILALPLVVFLSGVRLMSEMSNREYVINRLIDSNLPSGEKKPLNQRLGYDLNEVARYLKVFDPTALNKDQPRDTRETSLGPDGSPVWNQDPTCVLLAGGCMILVHRCSANQR
jgi:hypothetical protein